MSVCIFTLALGNLTNIPQIFYANNGTTMNADTARVSAWVSSSSDILKHCSDMIKMAPSITPITNLNSGFRVYEVDSAVCDGLGRSQ